MAVNMWKNSLKNVESDNNKILYETLRFFYSETVLTVWTSIVIYYFNKEQYALPEDDRVIETCRSILCVLMYILD